MEIENKKRSRGGRPATGQQRFPVNLCMAPESRETLKAAAKAARKSMASLAEEILLASPKLRALAQSISPTSR